MRAFSKISDILPVCVVAMAFEANAATVPVDLRAFDERSPIRVEQGTDVLNIRWLGSEGRFCELVFSLTQGTPLIRSMGTMETAMDAATVVLRNVDPVTLLTVGERDLAKRAGWVIFFDKVHQRPYESFRVRLTPDQFVVTSEGDRLTVTVGRAAAGSFSGYYQFKLHSGSSLIRFDTVLSTAKNGRAIIYDTGIQSADAGWEHSVWRGTDDQLHRGADQSERKAATHSVRYRSVAADGVGGSVVVFPPPHQFFYPLDFADNFGFVWEGRGYRDMVNVRSIGVRQPLDGDRRFVPWFNAPPLTDQHLGVYWYLTNDDPEEALAAVSRYTREDRYEPLEGYQRFTSHYHIEHTLDYLKRQRAQDSKGIPEGLESPGFVEAFRRVGADIVHLAEFHVGRTPRLKTNERLAQLQLMHEECRRLSDESFLLLPGEEPNVHLGGHWISFFPRPVNWVLNRPEGTPFAQQVDGLGTVYHVGSAEDVLRLMEREQGLMWTAHPRIKSSTGYPDAYRERAFFKSDRYLGSAWKAMPADLSWRRLGKRVLGLLDDMANWGDKKYVLGEVDVFKVEPEYELYGHMNMNYLRLPRIPRYDDGWGSVLQALREGRFFVTTGEVLMPQFTISGKESGETVQQTSDGFHELRFELDWTFPLSFVEVISGDGATVSRETIELADTPEFGRRVFERRVKLSGKRWVRLEAWDSAANGAFTQPVWIDD